jgi:hypothetical protein
MNSAQSNKTPATIKEKLKLKFTMKSQTQEGLLKNDDKSINSEKNEVQSRVPSHSSRSPRVSISNDKQTSVNIKSENVQDLHRSALENSKVVNKMGKEYGLINADGSKEKSADVTVDYQDISLESRENQRSKEKNSDVTVDRHEIELSVESREIRNSVHGLETEPSKNNRIN